MIKSELVICWFYQVAPPRWHSARLSEWFTWVCYLLSEISTTNKAVLSLFSGCRTYTFMYTEFLTVSHEVETTSRRVFLCVVDIFPENLPWLTIMMLKWRLIGLEAERRQVSVNMLVQSFTHRHYQIILIGRLPVVVLTSSDITFHTHT